MKTDTKLIIVGVVALGLGVWYVQRRVSAAVDGVGQGITDAWNGIGNGLAAALATPMEAGRELIRGTGFDGYTDPGGTFTPYGAVPSSYSGYVPWYLGAGQSDMFGPAGYTGPGLFDGLWPSSTVQQATQADVRRVDNAIDATGTGRRWWEVMATQSA